MLLHEYTHYVNANTTDFDPGEMATDELGVLVMPGAIDEGSADYFSCTVNNDPTVGEASLGLLGMERHIDQVHGMCPEDVMGEAHYDGEFVSSTAWAVRTALGQTLGDQLIWKAMSMLTTSPALGDWGENVLTAANDPDLALTSDQIQQVQQAVAAQGLNDCKRILDLSQSKPRTVLLFGLEDLAAMMGETGIKLQ